VTGYRFTLALREPSLGTLRTELVELAGIPAIGRRLRVALGTGEADLWIAGKTWFHAPGTLSFCGQLILSQEMR
jgi:hypothetical protein